MIDARQFRHALEDIVEALEVCEGNRGRFSCVDPHDCRCPKSRASSPEQWKGDWVCECGAEELDRAIERANTLLVDYAIEPI